jgi:hypothetical protein
MAGKQLMFPDPARGHPHAGVDKLAQAVPVVPGRSVAHAGPVPAGGGR